MPDREHMPETDLERELRELGSRLEHPPTPDLAPAVRDRISTDAVRPVRRSWPGRRSPQWLAAAVLLLVLLVPAFSPATRETLSGLFARGDAGGAGSEVGVSEQSSGENASPDQPAEAPAASAESQPAPSSDIVVAPDEEEPLPPEEDFDRKVIKTADLGLRSGNVRRSAAEAQQVAAEFGGNVQSSRIRQGGGPVSAELVLSIPAPEFEAALEELRRLGRKVTTDSVGGKDVTEEFVDLKSRERNLLAAEESLLELFEDAGDVDDSLAIQRELTTVRGEIEQVQGRIKYLEQRTESSRIELTIRQVRDESPPETSWSPLDDAGQAWNASLGLLQAFATTAISVAVFSWWLIPLPVAGFVWWRQRNQAPDRSGTG
ncbi:MAG: DUF4349 domain-containing protein [Rubrobacteraceae bacterium]